MNTLEITLDSYLREQTSSIHQLTEKSLEPLQLFTDLSLENYASFIRIQYRWHKALERILASENSALIFDGYNYTPKASLLHKDMQALGVNADFPELVEQNHLAIPGIIYVLEGSMLGGTVISKQLEKGGIAPEFRHYFSHCAESAKVVWPLTRKYLQAVENQANYFETCLSTSIFCFEKMIQMVKEEIAEQNL